MRLHWKVLAWMVAGALVGLAMQRFLDGSAGAGASFAAHEDGLELVSLRAGGPLAKGKVAEGDVIAAVVLRKGQHGPDATELRIDLRGAVDLGPVLDRARNGDVVWFELADGGERLVALDLDPSSDLATWIRPFTFVADIFMALLKMLIVPIVLTSIVTGVAGVGGFRDLRRLGVKTLSFYVVSSLLAILLGQVVISTFRLGDGATLGLAQVDADRLVPDGGFLDVLRRMVPANVFESLGDNGALLQVIFFALLLGFCITRASEPHRTRVKELFASLFQVMLMMAEWVLRLLPYGVFCLLVKVVAGTGVALFEPMLAFMALITITLVLHAAVTLPLLLRVFGRVSPLRWFRAMSPALMTAFTTSSSNMTLPVTMETVEKRGGVSNKVSSFTLPLGATINMDGTALYECVGVIFLAQYYASTGDFELTLGKQALVVLMALLASIGAAGLPSAGLVMMLGILSTLGLPVEGAALLLAIDRPLDMLRTVVNVWSDTCCAAIVASGEGETVLATET